MVYCLSTMIHLQSYSWIKVNLQQDVLDSIFSALVENTFYRIQNIFSYLQESFRLCSLDWDHSSDTTLISACPSKWTESCKHIHAARLHFLYSSVCFHCQLLVRFITMRSWLSLGNTGFKPFFKAFQINLPELTEFSISKALSELKFQFSCSA